MRRLSRAGLLFSTLVVFTQAASAFSPQEQQIISQFTGGSLKTDVSTMERDGKLAAELSAKPWAGYYWPESFGGIAVPWRDNSFPSSPIRMIGPDSGFAGTHRWFKKHRGNDFSANASSLDDQALNELSPAEKYDLLFTDSGYSLTHNVLNTIVDKAKKYKIRPWEGICNGWSLAALSTERPLHAVQARTAAGRMITFYPHDIMALAAQLYARSPVNNWDWFVNHPDGTRTQIFNDGENTAGATFDPIWLKFLGRRCNKTVKTGCGDLNPAALHLAIVNSIGYQDSGFVMDKHKDPTISNVAVFGYEAKLFNPKNGKFGNFSETAVTENNERKVGVILTVRFRKELHPFGLNDKKEEHYWDFEKHGELKYSYVLKLDAQNNVVDGDWAIRMAGIGARDEVIQRFPDFLWKLPKGMKAFSGSEGNLNQGDWNLANGIPASWAQAAASSAQFQQPLGVVLYSLIEQSRKP